MTGISVTPVVGFIGELNEVEVRPNLDEVATVLIHYPFEALKNLGIDRPEHI